MWLKSINLLQGGQIEEGCGYSGVGEYYSFGGGVLEAKVEGIIVKRAGKNTKFFHRGTNSNRDVTQYRSWLSMTTSLLIRLILRITLRSDSG